jgi:hypothetical protein
LVKFSVIGSPRRGGGAASCANAAGRQAAASRCTARATVQRRMALWDGDFMVNPE